MSSSRCPKFLGFYVTVLFLQLPILIPDLHLSLSVDFYILLLNQ